MTRKEHQNSFDSIKFGKETDPLTFGSKDRYELNDSRMGANLAELEAKDADDCSNFKITDDSSMDNGIGKTGSPKVADQKGVSHHISMDDENGTIDSLRKESKDGLSHHLSICDNDADSLSSDSSDIDKEQRSVEHESFDTVEEFADCNESEARDSSSQFFTDKNVLECDRPEFEVFYKEMDCQVLKDICVDEGRPHKDINVIDSKEDSSFDADGITVDQCGSKEENDGKKLISQQRLDSCVKNSLEKDTVDHFEPMNAAETGEANFDATGKGELDSSNSMEDSLVDMKVPVEDFDTQSSLELDGVDKVLNQEAGDTGEDVQASSLLYDSKVETGSITFNFSSPEGVVFGNSMTENVEDPSGESENMHKDVITETLPDAREEKAHCTNNRVVDSHKQSLISDKENSDATSCGNAHEGSLDRKQANSDDMSTPIDHPLQSPTNNGPVPTNEVNAPELNHNERETRDAPIVSNDMGETSFSAASMITYSGPIAFSGSLSHRSDGSTTSGKSFAFPILQSEWNSSPVRMAKADRRHFRKQKGWRSGLLCCRF